MKRSQSSDCLWCKSIKTKKYGLLKTGGQRYKCKECNHTFTIGGSRGTYDEEFKQRVIENYCHKKTTVAEILEHYHISSRTLIKRSHHHKQLCQQCTHHQ